MRIFLSLLVILTAAAGQTEAQTADTLIVCPQAFQPGLAKWLDYREKQGHRFKIVTSSPTAEGLKQQIIAVADEGGLKTVILVGDADTKLLSNPATAALHVPTQHVQAKINVKYGSEPEIATDNWFADLDNDQLPDLAIGRIPVDSVNQLSQFLDRVIQFETNDDFGKWRRQINLIAGVGGFGKIADTVLESSTKKFITDRIPKEYSTTMTYASWQSPYCPDPRRFSETTIGRFNEGCLFWVYIGHGHYKFLDQVRTPGFKFHIFDQNDVAKLKPKGKSPIAIFLACYTGAFDYPQDCLAESMLLTADGPISVLGATRVSLPYSMSVLANEMLDEYFTNRQTTMGELFKNSKRRMIPEEGKPIDKNRLWLDLLGQTFSPTRDALEDELREHLDLFHLFGDPLLRLHHPGEISLTSLERTAAGSKLLISGESNIAGELTIELALKRDRLGFRPPARDGFFPAPVFLDEFQQIYEKANSKIRTFAKGKIPAGKFQAELQIPADVRGAYHLRAFVKGDNDFAMGISDVFINLPTSVANQDSTSQR